MLGRKIKAGKEFENAWSGKGGGGRCPSRQDAQRRLLSESLAQDIQNPGVKGVLGRGL